MRDLVDRIRRDHGRLDVLVNDIFGGDRYAQWDQPLWEHDLTGGLRMLRMGVETHIVTSSIALPLMLETGAGLLVEMTDGTSAVNARRPRRGRVLLRLRQGERRPAGEELRRRARRPPGHRARRDSGMAPLGAHAGELRRHRGHLARGLRTAPGFAISESPAYVARGVAALAADSSHRRFAGRVLTARQLSDDYGTTDTDGSRPDCWGLIAERGWDEQDPQVISRYR